MIKILHHKIRICTRCYRHADQPYTYLNKYGMFIFMFGCKRCLKSGQLRDYDL